MTNEPRAIMYGIVNCDTVKAARRELDRRAVAYEFWDYKKRGVPIDRLRAWMHRAGREALLQRKGTTWRKLDETTKATADTIEGAVNLLLDNASAIRRPVVEWPDGKLTIGFRNDEFCEV